MRADALAALARLKQKFIVRSAGDLQCLREHQRAPLDPKELHLVVHRLAGAAGTFGFADLSAAAEAAEYALLFEPAAADGKVHALIATLASTVAGEGPSG